MFKIVQELQYGMFSQVFAWIKMGKGKCSDTLMCLIISPLLATPHIVYMIQQATKLQHGAFYFKEYLCNSWSLRVTENNLLKLNEPL